MRMEGLKLPLWVRETQYDDGVGYSVVDNDHNYIAEAEILNKDMCEYIVQACNGYPKLKEELKKFKQARLFFEQDELEELIIRGKEYQALKEIERKFKIQEHIEEEFHKQINLHISQKKALKVENEKLKEENKELSKRNKDLNKGFDRFKAEMYDLKEENERLKELNSDLDYLVYQNGLELEAEKAIEQLRQQRDELAEMLERYNKRLKNQVEIFGYASRSEIGLFSEAEQLLQEIKEG